MLFGEKTSNTALWNLIAVIESVQGDFDALMVVAQKRGLQAGSKKREIIR